LFFIYYDDIKNFFLGSFFFLLIEHSLFKNTLDGDAIVFGRFGIEKYFGFSVNGKIDDIRIYNHVLNENEIPSLFNEK